jgi:hypothetical protein
MTEWYKSHRKSVFKTIVDEHKEFLSSRVDKQGRVELKGKDLEDCNFYMAETYKEGQISIGLNLTSGNCARIDQKMAKEIIVHLQKFIDTGKLE